MSDTKDEVVQLRGKRRGNQSVETKLVNEAGGILEAEATDQQRLKFMSCSLDENLRPVESLDEEIINICPVGEIESEIEESQDVNSHAMEILQIAIEAMNPKLTEQGMSTENTTSTHQTVSSVPLLQTSSLGPQTSNLSGNALSEELGSLIPPGFQSFSVPSIAHTRILQASGSSGMAFQLPTNFSPNLNSMPCHLMAKLPKLVPPRF